MGHKRFLFLRMMAIPRVSGSHARSKGIRRRMHRLSLKASRLAVAEDNKGVLSFALHGVRSAAHALLLFRRFRKAVPRSRARGPLLLLLVH